MGSTRSSGRFGFSDGRNSSLNRDDDAWRRGADWSSDVGADAGAALVRVAAELGRLGSGLEGPESTLV